MNELDKLIEEHKKNCAICKFNEWFDKQKRVKEIISNTCYYVKAVEDVRKDNYKRQIELKRELLKRTIDSLKDIRKVTDCEIINGKLEELVRVAGGVEG